MLSPRGNLIVTIVAGALVALLVAVAVAQTPGDAAVMRINGQEVYAAEFALVVDNIMEQSRQLGQKLSAREAFPAAVKRVIEQKLLSQEARRLGLEADAEEVQATLRDVIAESGGQRPFEARLRRVGHSLQLLEQSMRETNLVHQLVQDRIKPSITVTEADIQGYWQEHPELFRHPEQLRIRQILCRTTDPAAAERRAAARHCAQTAIDRLAAGEPFPAVAQDLSDGPAAAQGGDLGFVDPSRLPEAIADVAWTLEEGTVSGPIATETGLHVIRVEDHRSAGTHSLEEAREQIVSEIRIDRSTEIVENLVADLRAQATIEPVENAPSLDEIIGDDDSS